MNIRLKYNTHESMASISGVEVLQASIEHMQNMAAMDTYSCHSISLSEMEIRSSKN